MSKMIKLKEPKTIVGIKRKKGEIVKVSSSIFDDLVLVQKVAKEYKEGSKK